MFVHFNETGKRSVKTGDKDGRVGCSELTENTPNLELLKAKNIPPLLFCL